VLDVQIDGVDEEMDRLIRFADDVQTTFSDVDTISRHVANRGTAMVIELSANVVNLKWAASGHQV
jgi:hypothetical protein